MILQIFTDAWKILSDLNAVRLQKCTRPDAGQLQDLRRGDGTCREDDLGNGFGEILRTIFRIDDVGCAAILYYHAFDKGTGF